MLAFNTVCQSMSYLSLQEEIPDNGPLCDSGLSLLDSLRFLGYNWPHCETLIHRSQRPEGASSKQGGPPQRPLTDPPVLILPESKGTQR